MTYSLNINLGFPKSSQVNLICYQMSTFTPNPSPIPAPDFHFSYPELLLETCSRLSGFQSVIPSNKQKKPYGFPSAHHSWDNSEVSSGAAS